MTALKAEIEGQIAAIMRRPYHLEIHGTPEDGYLAAVREFDGCFTAGETPEEALALLQDGMAGWLESMLADELPIPEPTPESPAQRYSGRLLIRVPKSIHRELAERAAAEDVSINQLVLTYLAAGLAGRAGAPAR